MVLNALPPWRFMIDSWVVVKAKKGYSIPPVSTVMVASVFRRITVKLYLLIDMVVLKATKNEKEVMAIKMVMVVAPRRRRITTRQRVKTQKRATKR